jgi:hypothetical protein
MFLSHGETDQRDKVSGLLGMCSDPHMTATLQPDYSNVGDKRVGQTSESDTFAKNLLIQRYLCQY